MTSPGALTATPGPSHLPLLGVVSTGEFCRERHIAARTVMVAFSSLGVDSPEKRFEFEGLLQRQDCSAILVRDVSTSWFHDVPGQEGGVDGLAAFLAARTRGYDRVVCLGYSMGGYAALLFGGLLGADSVMALAPQTAVTAAALDVLGDRRWPAQVAALRTRTSQPAVLDLQAVYEAPRPVPSGQAVSIYVGAHADPLDLAHARRLERHAAIVQIGAAPLAHSALVVGLRESGLLRQLIDDAVAGVRADRAGVYPAWMHGRRHRLEIGELALAADGRLRIQGAVVNTAGQPIDLARGAPQRVRVGARLWPRGRVGVHRAEYRYDFSAQELWPDERRPFAFDLDLSPLPAGPHDLAVALVKEGRFWFDDLGFAAANLALEAAPFRLTGFSTTGLQ